MTEPSSFAHKPTLTGERVVLRPFVAADLEVLVAAMADPDVGRLTGSEHTSAAAAAAPTEADERTRAWYATRNAQTDRLDLMIVEARTGTGVGEIVLNEWDPGNESCNLRILIGPAGQNRGLGSEAVRLLTDWAFAHLPLHRISLEVYDFNPRARRAYEKAGFVAEGRLRDALLFDGEWIDAIVMSRLRTDRP